ncbi:MAG: class A sortase [Lactobacillus sp.]|nr:class A sortase [Lactobacillus sp.]
MEKKTKTKRKIVKTLAVIFFVVGLGLIASDPISHWLVSWNQRNALNGLTASKIAANKRKKGMFDFSKVGSMDPVKATKARIKNTANAIGAIAIPKVKLYLPIMLGLSDDSLSTGGGTMRADQKMGEGNYPLAGHYMTAKGILFSPLENTKIGQKVYLTDLKKVYVYKIYYKKVVDPTSVWLVDNTEKKIVTLITCADGGINRWAVRGNLIKVEKASHHNLEVFKLK